MARPNSKYFASVITKLIAAKRKENIVVDESFKMQLRSDLLNRISAPVIEARPPIDIGALFGKWKYALTLIPSALVVMLIAVQFVDMPVTIPSEQIIPTASQETTFAEEDAQEKSENVAIIEGSSSDSELSLEQNSSTSSVRKIRTFPGALALPRNLDDNIAADVVSFETETVQSEKSESKGTESPDDVNGTSLVSLPFNFFGFNSNVQAEEDPVPAHREERTTSKDGGSTNAQVIEADDIVPVENVSDSSTIMHVEDAQEVGGIVETEGIVLAENVDPIVAEEPEREITDEVEDEFARNIVGGVTPEAMTVQNVQMAEPLAPVFQFMEYGVNLDSLEREVLENRVVPSLADGRDIENVYVSEEENNIVSIEVLFENGEKIQKFYTFNRRTNSWDYVEYVTRQHYDNSLMYTTNFVYQVSPY